MKQNDLHKVTETTTTFWIPLILGILIGGLILGVEVYYHWRK